MEDLSTHIIKEGIKEIKENATTKIVFKIFIMFIAWLVMLGLSLSIAYAIYAILIKFDVPNPYVITIGLTLTALFAAITPLLYALLRKRKLKKEQNINQNTMATKKGQSYKELIILAVVVAVILIYLISTGKIYFGP